MDWLYWIITLAVTTALGIISFFFKRTLTQIDRRQELAEKKLVEELARLETRYSKTDDRITHLEERFNKMMHDMPHVYTLREDWTRSISYIQQKLDKIYDHITSMTK